MIETAYIALGSNLGDRRKHIDRALEAVARTPGIELAAVSAIRETAPIGAPGQGPYLNAVARVATSLSPRALLAACRGIEFERGRRREEERVRWGPRTLDLDILLFGERIIDEPGLTVPHPRLHERDFVLEPLVELAPALRHPVLGATLEVLRGRLAHGRPEVSSGLLGTNPPGVRTS